MPIFQKMKYNGLRVFRITVYIGIICNAGMSMALAKDNIKKPNVSGQFYSSDPIQLAADISKYFSDATVNPVTNHIDIIIAPHAGYMYSGGVAAYSFKAVSQKQYKTIVILAPSHFYGFPGVSIWKEGGFETPLGIAEVDQDFAQSLIQADSLFAFDPNAFAKEHSLEVEIPFLQQTFQNFKIVPVIMGQTSFAVLEKFSRSLHKIIGAREDILVVVSTDLSHYHNDETARRMDGEAITAIEALQAEEIFEGCRNQTMEMCGCMPVTASILLARLRGLKKVDVLKYAHSGDVSGDKTSVVGYSAIVFLRDVSQKTDATLTLDQKKILIKLARQTVEDYVRNGKRRDVDVTDPRLKEIEGAFVTLRKNGELRGCIGNIIGRQPLCLTVRDMAIASASEDQRFKPVTADELDDIDVEVSVLSKPWRIKEHSEFELGKHGVIVRKGRNQGVFLPQVAEETGWSKEEFLSTLCSQKAGLPPDAWKDPDTILEVFTAQVFSEKDFE